MPRLYGKIPHLPGSRTGPSDRHVDGGTARRMTAGARPGDRVIVQEKLDGSCVAVVRRGGAITAFGRDGQPCASARNDGRRAFAAWVEVHARRFAWLAEGREHAGRRCTVRVVVALAEAPGAEGVRVFTGEIQGVVASAPRGADGYGWDRVLVPDGYERTLAELGASKYLVSMRVPRLGRVRAGERFAALEADLTALDVPLRARIREFTVYDSNVALDRGWL